MGREIPTRFDYAEAETRLYRFWEGRGYFRGGVRPGKKRFSVVIPPPNITGILHMGHVLDNTPQDIMARMRRMQGHETCWVPGTDHAGIATQNVVEKDLRKQKIRRQDLGREKFVERVWQWREQYGNTIIAQLKRLGCSCDWDRTRFTMDDGLSAAVLEVFCRLFHKGLIYRGDYIVNWCPRCLTALSDEEAEKREIEGGLYPIHYPVKESNERLTIATTRPETMLGDTAVAVHPEDPRYRHLVGKTVILPLLQREIPIIADPYVDREFGTGALKITPAHDPNDFLIGQRHHLPFLNVMTPDAKMNEHAGPYRGLTREECRKKVWEDLQALGLAGERKPHLHAVGHCYRCDTLIEPYLSKQWFVKMKPLAEPAIRVVKDGTLKFFPDLWSKTYLEWMENIRDWCISRQLWWGHRIPVWYCDACGALTVQKTAPTACCKCASPKIRQDEDVLDTWFSSWLWPFSTLGWPEPTESLSYYYPTDWLNSGKDIIFFWVARMIMAGLEFMGDVPFRHVYIHMIARDSQRRKLSKSLGNSPDPLELFDKFGTDAVRFGIMANTPMSEDVILSDEVYTYGRNFVTKVWNACRFLIMNVEEGDRLDGPPGDSFVDRWILSRLHGAAEEATAKLDVYDFGEAARILYQFFWSDFCDWYVEMVKPLLAKDADPARRAATLRTTVECLSISLRIMHPIAPFVTEEIWQHFRSLPGLQATLAESIMIAPWPAPDAARRSPDAEASMALLAGVVRGVRDVRNKNNISRATKLVALVNARDEAAARALRERTDLVTHLAGLERLDIGVGTAKPAHSATVVAGALEIYLPLEGVIDLGAERTRLTHQAGKIEGQLAQVKAKLESPGFRANAPADLVAREQARAADLEAQRAAVKSSLRDLGEA